MVGSELKATLPPLTLGWRLKFAIWFCCRVCTIAVDIRINARIVFMAKNLRRADNRPWGTDNGGGKPALDLVHSFVLAKINNDMVGKALHHFIKRREKCE